MYVINIDKSVTPWKHRVYEKKTENVIRTFQTWEDASNYIKFLRSGGAFAGWTPSFFLKEFKYV